MNTIPMDALVRALEALKLAHARLNDPKAPDPYMAVLKAESELEWFIGKFTPVQVTP